MYHKKTLKYIHILQNNIKCKIINYPRRLIMHVTA